MNLREDRTSKRHRSHADASYARLLHRVQEVAGLKTREKAEIALLISLERILRRIPPANALHILAQAAKTSRPALYISTMMDVIREDGHPRDVTYLTSFIMHHASERGLLGH